MAFLRIIDNVCFAPKADIQSKRQDLPSHCQRSWSERIHTGLGEDRAEVRA